jgi:hypothetical protein
MADKEPIRAAAPRAKLDSSQMAQMCKSWFKRDESWILQPQVSSIAVPPLDDYQDTSVQ